jgi:hypothetical protein
MSFGSEISSGYADLHTGLDPAAKTDPLGHSSGPLPKPQTESPADDAAKAELLSALAAEDEDDQEPL